MRSCDRAHLSRDEVKGLASLVGKLEQGEFNKVRDAVWSLGCARYTADRHGHSGFGLWCTEKIRRAIDRVEED